MTDDSFYDSASWYRRHRGDPPLDIGLREDEKRTARRVPKDTENIWAPEYAECGEDPNSITDPDAGVFGSLFE